MANVPVRLATAQLTAAAVVLYTATAVKTTITAMTIRNANAAATTATIHLVPSGNVAADSNCILSAKSLAQNETYRVIEAIGQTLEAGGTIQALASSAARINIVASGVEYA